MLNDKLEFKDLNPSLENFARILAISLSDCIQAKNITALRVKLWENENAWAAFIVKR